MWMIIIGCILFFLGLIGILLLTNWNFNGFIFSLGIAFGVGFFFIGITEDKPTALDVYQGKTTLEITSVNGISKDTTVVFKKK